MLFFLSFCCCKKQKVPFCICSVITFNSHQHFSIYAFLTQDWVFFSLSAEHAVSHVPWGCHYTAKSDIWCTLRKAVLQYIKLEYIIIKRLLITSLNMGACTICSGCYSLPCSDSLWRDWSIAPRVSGFIGHFSSLHIGLCFIGEHLYISMWAVFFHAVLLKRM